MKDEEGEFVLDGNNSYVAIRDWGTDWGAHTLLHEALHVLCDLRGLEASEELIRGLETGLVALFRRNPWLIDKVMNGTSYSPLR